MRIENLTTPLLFLMAMNGLQAATATINLNAGELRNAAGTVIGDSQGVWAVIVAGQPGNPPTSGALPGGLTLGTSLTAGSLSQIASDLGGQKLQVGSVGNFYIAYLQNFDSGASELGTPGFAFGGFNLDVNSGGDPGFTSGTSWGLYWFPGQSFGSTLYGSFEVGGFANSVNAASGGEAGTTVPSAGATVTAQFFETTFNQGVLAGDDTGLTANRFTAVSVPAPTGTFSWDTNLTTSGVQGGTGTWNTTSPNWQIGSSNNLWAATGTNNDAIFGATAGTVTISSSVAANDLTFNTNGYIITGGTLTLNGTTPTVTTATGVTATISSQILGSAGLVKAGAGILELNGSNSYTGTTQVNAGKLAVNGSLAGSDVQVAADARLGGTGIISGAATTIASGGIHAPGNSVGIQTVAGITYQGGSIFEWELASVDGDTTTGTRGTDYDGVNVTGALATTGSGAIFRVVLSGSEDFSNAFWSQNREWTDIFKTANNGTLVSYQSIFSDFELYNYAGGSLNPLGDVSTLGSFSIDGSTLKWAAVPEPTSALAGLLIAAGLLRRRR